MYLQCWNQIGSSYEQFKDAVPNFCSLQAMKNGHLATFLSLLSKFIFLGSINGYSITQFQQFALCYSVLAPFNGFHLPPRL